MVDTARDRSRQRAREDYVKGIYHLSGDAPALVNFFLADVRGSRGPHLGRAGSPASI